MYIHWYITEQNTILVPHSETKIPLYILLFLVRHTLITSQEILFNWTEQKKQVILKKQSEGSSDIYCYPIKISREPHWFSKHTLQKSSGIQSLRLRQHSTKYKTQPSFSQMSCLKISSHKLIAVLAHIGKMYWARKLLASPPLSPSLLSASLSLFFL